MSARFGALLLLLTCAINAQEQPVAVVEQPTLRVTFTLVQVDAVVTDAAGRRVTDLKAGDFELRQDGVPQKITHFTYFPDDRPPVIAAVKTKGGIGMPIGTVPLDAMAVKRTVALVVDDRGLSFESIVRVRDSLRKYVESYMQPGDLVAILRTGGGVSVLEQFTSDKKVLLAGIDLLKWRFGGRVGLMAINPLSGAAAKPEGPELLDYDPAMQALGALGTLDQVIRGMRKLPGRKSVVFLSDSMRMDARINGQLDHLTDMANRAAVSLYGVDPAGLKVKGLSNNVEEQEEPDRQGPSIGGGIFGGMGATDAQSQDGLDYLARRTGGLFFTGRNDIPQLIRQAVDDQMGYYLIGYSPQEGTFEKNPEKAKYHKIGLRVKRPGAKVRWKSGFNGITDGDADSQGPAIAQTREQQLLEALASPFAAKDVGLRLTCFYNDFGAQGAYVRSMLHFQGRDLTFRQQMDLTWHASVDIVATTYRGIKEPIQQRQRREEIKLPDDVYRKALKEGFLYSWDFPIKEPGTFMMRAVVRDAETAKLGSASQAVTVPDTRKGQLAISGIVIKLASNEQAGMKAADPAGGAGKAEAWTEGGPAIRRYLQAQSILYSFVVVNAKRTGPAKKSDLMKELLVYKDGKLLFRGEPTPINETGKLDERRVVGSGMLKLGTASAPGEYILQIVVTDKHAPKKKSQVSQWIDFEVVKQGQLKAQVER